MRRHSISGRAARPAALRTKRGSALVTAVFLLLFVVLMGSVLVLAGLQNVQNTVNTRDSRQAYYTAKSLLDTTLDSLTQDGSSALAGMDDALKATAPGGSVEASGISLGSLPVDVQNGVPKASFTLTCTEVPADIENGVQKFTATAAATYKGYTRAVARTLEIERRPGGGVTGFIGGGSGAGSASYTLRDLDLTGDLNIFNANSVQIGGTVNVSGSTTLYASSSVTIEGGAKARLGSKDTTAEIRTPTLSISTPQSNIYNADIYGRVNFYSNANQNSVFKGSYQKNTYAAPDTVPVYTLNAPSASGDAVKVDAAWKLNSQTITADTVLTSGGWVDGLTVDTGGGSIVAAAPTLGLTGNLTVRGGGSVTFVTDGDLSAYCRLIRSDDTKVTFISRNGGIRLQGNGAYTYEANFLCPRGTLTMTTTGTAIHGTVWCNCLVANAGMAIDTTPPQNGVWWGDVSSFSAGGNGGGSTLTCTTGAYMAPEE